MRLTKFRIYNFKSIADSGECRVSKDFTVLVGKNESGKTAILEALQSFDRDQFVLPENAYPLSGINEDPAVEMVFQMSAQELGSIEQELGFKVKDDVRNKILRRGIRLIKSALGEYQLKNEFDDRLFDDVPQSGGQTETSQIQVKKQKLDELLSGYPTPALNLENDEALKKSLKTLALSVRSRLGVMRDDQKRDAISEVFEDIVKEIHGSDRQKLTSSPKANFINSVVKRLPRFVLFGQLKDILPFEISINDLTSNQAVMDFARIANLDIDRVMKTEEMQRRINLLNRHSATISMDFMGYWEQNKIELIVRPLGDKLLFGVQEVGKTDFFKVEQRSKGFQWFLSFYLRLHSYRDSDVIILIDEPGKDLHPIAQKNILNVLERKSSGAMQVVFSTHSPSLINTERLDRVRLVIKDRARGSVIEEDLNEVADEDTLMPVKTALGAKMPIQVPVIQREEEPLDAEPDQEPQSAQVAQATPSQSDEQAISESESREESQPSQGEQIPEPVKRRGRSGFMGLFKRKGETAIRSEANEAEDAGTPAQ